MNIFYFNITYRCNSNCIFCAANHPLWQDNSEMTADEFKQILDERHVAAGDRVIVNGGEPTVHKEFWTILDTIDQRGATIDLFTNGIRLRDESFAKRLLKYDNLHIRIPLFGSTGELHDRLTGVPGNFEATTEALDHLIRNIRGHVTIEIKLLMSKATIEDNERIYDLIRERWQHEAVRISLNPLLISECVIQQKDIMIDTYESMMQKSEALIRRALAEGVDFSVALVPYCTYPNEELLHMCRGRRCGGNMFYASPGYQKNINRMAWRNPCLQCKYVSECNGFSKNYVEYFGSGVMKPFVDTGI